MNVAISIIKTNSKWLWMLLSLVAGTLLASTVGGQEPLTETGNHGSTTSLELATDSNTQDSITQATAEIVQQPPCCPLEGQRVCTQDRCGFRRPVNVSANDEIWLVSGRNSHLAPCDLDGLKVCKLCRGDWVESGLNDLVSQHSTDKSRVTMIYVHGNRTDLAWAKSRGMQFYDHALQKGCLERPPVRFVIFAWKSEMERTRLYPDYRIKSHRSFQLGTTFGEFLCQFEDRNMVIGGFSLGAQIVMQGLSNPGLQNPIDPFGKFKIAVIAPALNPDYVSCGLLCYPCNPTVEQTDVFLNRDDRAVRAAQLIVRNRSNGCITTLEQLADQSASALNPVRIVDITSEVSKRHSIVKYAHSASLRNGLATMLSSIQLANSSVQSETERAVSVSEDAAAPSN